LTGLLEAAGKTRADAEADMRSVAAMHKARTLAAGERQCDREYARARAAWRAAADALPGRLEALRTEATELERACRQAESRWLRAREARLRAAALAEALARRGMPAGLPNEAGQPASGDDKAKPDAGQDASDGPAGPPAVKRTRR
jgi:hypothetical protein